MEDDDITRRIIGCAYRVYNAMGYGFLESVYENCMLLELRAIGLRVVNQHPIQVRYLGQVVGEFTADLLVEDLVIVELKAVRALLMIHEVQVVNYLKATGIDVGLLLNFGEPKVEVKRKLRVLPHDSDSSD